MIIMGLTSLDVEVHQAADAYRNWWPSQYHSAKRLIMQDVPRQPILKWIT